MGIQSFFKQRRPRQFQHKLIYWDPKKEELAERVERIRKELIASGELDEADVQALAEAEQATSVSDSDLATSAEGYDASRQIRGSFVGATRHLQRQQKQGVTSADRDQRMIRLMLCVLALGLVFWYFFLR